MVVVCLVRNGAAYMEEFLRHYRSLGVAHIVFLDNGSDDGGPEKIANEVGVTVLQTYAPYKHYKDIMKRFLVERFGENNWVLCVDIDELFEYPGQTFLPMKGLIHYLTKNRYTAVVAQLLDMFPQGELSISDSGQWRQEHRFYDLSDLEVQDYESFYEGRNAAPAAALKVIHGGIRSSKFNVRALLTKHPLLFPSAGVSYNHAHHVTGARVADLSAVLLHYKYVGDFLGYMKTIVQEESFSMGSREYKAYLEAITARQGLSLHSEGAQEYENIDQLVSQGFVVTSESYREYIRQSTQVPL